MENTSVNLVKVLFIYNVSLFLILFSSVKGVLYELITNQTKIIGKKLFTVYDNRPYAAFLNIPYALPPIADLRFKPPKDLPIFLEEGRTYDFSKEYISSGTLLAEDLTLSVYMPISKEKNKSFSVAVWVCEGSDDHGPDFLIEEEILVVVVNFRISILGFLNTDDEFAKGNMGAKDVLMSLKCIRSNIYIFNGDINKVTVIGSGKAANVVASLLVSSAAEDLFKRLIIHGGSALSPVDYGNHNLKVTNKLYRRLYVNSDKIDKEKLYEYLSKAPVEILIAMSHDLIDSSEIRDRQRLTRAFGCSIEKEKKISFMYEHPLKVHKNKLANYDVDVMFGYCNYEQLFKLKHFVNKRLLLKYLNFNFQYLLPFFGEMDEYNSKRYRNIQKRIKDFYFLNGTISERSFRRYVKYHTDQVIYPLIRQARLHNVQTHSSVYLYRFSYNGCFNTRWTSLPKLKWSGATSGDEICYQFKCKSLTDKYNSTEASVENRFIKQITRLLANFIKFGKPTLKITGRNFEGSHWEPIRANTTIKVLSMGRTLKMINLPEQKRIDFWDKLRDDCFDSKA